MESGKIPLSVRNFVGYKPEEKFMDRTFVIVKDLTAKKVLGLVRSKAEFVELLHDQFKQGNERHTFRYRMGGKKVTYHEAVDKLPIRLA
jgi:hypothetical protein